jgi:hypothetical protein
MGAPGVEQCVALIVTLLRRVVREANDTGVGVKAWEAVETDTPMGGNATDLNGV